MNNVIQFPVKRDLLKEIDGELEWIDQCIANSDKLIDDIQAHLADAKNQREQAIEFKLRAQAIKDGLKNGH